MYQREQYELNIGSRNEKKSTMKISGSDYNSLRESEVSKTSKDNDAGRYTGRQQQSDNLYWKD